MVINIQKARKIISENIYMTIASASKDGTPWISPVFFAYDQRYNLYWVSNKSSRHSKLIESNPKVAITVFDSSVPEGEGDGVYFECDVQILESTEEINNAIEILNKRVTKDEFRVKSIDQCTEDAPWRIYKAAPKVVSKLTEGKFINGQYVDQRVEIKL